VSHLNARSIVIRSLIFGFVLTAAAQVWIELPFNSGPPNLLARAALLILAPGQFVITAATFGMITEDDLWAGLVLNVVLWAALTATILLIRKHLTRRRRDAPVGSARISHD
jgi:xanthine/uracil permease